MSYHALLLESPDTTAKIYINPDKNLVDGQGSCLLYLPIPTQIFRSSFSGVTGVTGVTRIASQQTLTFLRNTKVTPDKLFDQSGVTPMFTAVVNRHMLVYDVYVLR